MKGMVKDDQRTKQLRQFDIIILPSDKLYLEHIEC